MKSFDLPPDAGGQWCRLRVHLPVASGWWARVTLTDPARDQIVRRVFLGPLHADAEGTWRETLLHVPSNAASVTLHVFGAAADRAALTVGVLNRWDAAARLLWHGRPLLPGAVAGAPLGLPGRLRAVLGQAPARAGEAPPYDMWIKQCEAALPAAPAAPPLDVQAAIFGDRVAGLAATLASLRGQTLPTHRPPCRIAAPQDWAGLSAAWVVVLQAGEVLAPHAFAWFAHAAACQPHAACITADFDRLAPDASRCDPVFLPGAGALLLRSGLPTAGPCALRWQPAFPVPTLTTARETRLALALRVADQVVHVPRILAHLPPGAPQAVAAPAPLARDPAFTPTVAALVPSQVRSMHVASCLRRVSENTAYPKLRVTVLLSAPARARPRVLRRLNRLPRVVVHTVRLHHFNYAAVNNAAAASVHDADLLLLLNDDVAPIAPDWLHRMVAHMQDPHVGIVGARLLYGNRMVQHEGVIMGLADLCEHAGRLRPAADPGPHGIGLVSRDVSAVTAACMLVRSSLYRDLGGMDEGFAIALNDVDFCLRARHAGWRIVYCAEAVLFHYESLSLGRHYAGGRAALEGLEVRRLRDRWAEVIEADPCYNLQASLEPGREWRPAFCPRAGLP